jgi:hypothetical protein
MNADLINGLFEFCGGVLLWLNVRRLRRDGRVAGVSVAPTVFWTAWGAWNLYFYPSVGCWASWAGGLFVVAANAAWLGLLLRLRLQKGHGPAGAPAAAHGHPAAAPTGEARR